MMFWINSPFDPLPLEGGRPLRYELLARALVELGHEVVWWSSDFHHLRKERRSLEPVYKHEGFEVRLIPTLPYQGNVSWRRWRSHLQYAKRWGVMAAEALASGELESPDAVIISMPPLGLYPVARKICDTARAKLFVDVQDAWPETFYQMLPQLPRFFKRVLLAPMQSMAAKEYRGADFLTAVAEKYIKLAGGYGCICPQKVFPLGGLLSDVVVQGEQGDQTLKLIYVGNLGSSYDLETMLECVVNLVSDGISVTLDVAGDGPCRRVVESAVEQSDGSIKFHGYLSGDELSQLMHKCGVGIIPMKDESLVVIPNKLVDYAGHSLAIINGLTSETKELLDKFDCGLIYDIGSQKSFKEAVMRYHDDRELLRSHKLNSRRMAEANFDSTKISLAMARWICKSLCDV